jgi:hypothetical protein
MWSGKLSWQEIGLQSLLGKNVVWKAYLAGNVFPKHSWQECGLEILVGNK